MISDTGVKPPLHRRFDKEVAMHQIRNRYRELRKKISKQVELLQKDVLFRQKVQEYYQRSYKDWVIVGAIFNCMLNWKARELGMKLPDEKERQKLVELQELVSDAVYPTEQFLGEDFDLQIKFHSLLALKSYGFEMRRMDFKPKVVEKFLRERMKHFDFDISHRLLFGEPPGDWPDI